jgi:MFS family permease
VFTLGLSLAAVIVVISQAVVSEFVPVAQRGAVLAIGTAFMTSAGVLAPYVMGDIVEKAATPVEGFFRGYTLIGAIMFAGGLIAMLFIRPEREAERLRQNGMRVPLPTPGLARQPAPEASKLRGRAENPYENTSETDRAVDDVPLASDFPAGSLQSRSAGKELSLLLHENPPPRH